MCMPQAPCQMGPDADVRANSENWGLGPTPRRAGLWGSWPGAAASGPRGWLGMAHHQGRPLLPGWGPRGGQREAAGVVWPGRRGTGPAGLQPPTPTPQGQAESTLQTALSLTPPWHDQLSRTSGGTGLGGESGVRGSSGRSSAQGDGDAAPTALPEGRAPPCSEAGQRKGRLSPPGLPPLWGTQTPGMASPGHTADAHHVPRNCGCLRPSLPTGGQQGRAGDRVLFGQRPEAAQVSGDKRRNFPPPLPGALGHSMCVGFVLRGSG